MYRLAVIILNYRTPTLVADCLASLVSEIDPAEHHVVVVDSASGDGSAEQIEQAVADNGWQAWVTVLPLQDNRGFSAGNNAGMRHLEADAYLLLNSDTLVRAGAIDHLLTALDTYPHAALISPRLEWPDAQPQISTFRFTSPFSQLIDAAATGPITKLFGRYNVPIPVSNDITRPDWTSFAAVLVRGSAKRQIGEMDEGYFMYFEDTDYCRQVWQSDWEVVHYPLAHVVHLRGGSSNVKAATKARKRRPTYYYASRARYLAKFYGVAGLWLSNIIWGCGRLIAGLRERLGQKTPHTCEREGSDNWINWRDPLKPFELGKE